MGKTKWILIFTELGTGLECEKCKHKISIKDYEMADISLATCPFCGEEMDLDSIDEDEIWDMLEGEFNNVKDY